MENLADDYQIHLERSSVAYDSGIRLPENRVVHVVNTNKKDPVTGA